MRETMSNECDLGGERSVFDVDRWHGLDHLDVLTPHPIREGTVTTTSKDAARPSYDLAGRDFVGKNFADEQMTYTFALGAQLIDVTFLRCNLRVSSFRNARLTDVRFLDCELDYSDFEGAYLDDVCFWGSSLKGTHLRTPRGTQVCFKDARWD